jgi:hypothetical protein
MKEKDRNKNDPSLCEKTEKDRASKVEIIVDRDLLLP